MKKSITIAIFLLISALTLSTDCNKIGVTAQGIVGTDISCGVNIIRNCNDKSCSSICRHYVQSHGHCIKNTKAPPDQFCNCDC